jgi:hypothetical protein
LEPPILKASNEDKLIGTTERAKNGLKVVQMGN